jgi:hypothetical protein
VIAEGGWVDVPDRTNSFYFKKSPLPEAIPSLEWLSTVYDIYVISTRGHEDANLGLRAWLHFGLRLELDTIAGVITYPNSPDKDRDAVTKMDKSAVVRALGICCHFDDDPVMVEACGSAGVLVPSDMPVSIAAANRLPTAKDWDTIRTFLTTPGMTLHGSNGMSIVSPADVKKEYPKLKQEVVM